MATMAEMPKSEPSPLRPLLPQFLVATVCCLISMINGASLGHSSVIISRLRDDDSLPINEEMGSWIASVYSAGIPVGNIIGGGLTDRLGRRRVLRLSQLPCMAGWILIASAQNPAMLIAGRFILGVAKGISIDAALVLLDEHSDPRLRGYMSCHIGVLYVLGILAVTGLNTVLDWRVVAGIASLCSLSLFAATWTIPESPLWLVRHGRLQKAASVLSRMLGKKHDRQCSRELRNLMARCESEGVLLRTLIQPYVIKPFVVSFLLILLQVFTGTHFFIFYSVDIISLARRGSQDLVDAYAVTNIAGFLRLVLTIILAWSLLVVPRRIIMLGSAVGSASCLFLIATIANNHIEGISERTESWIIITLIMIYIIASTGGIFMIPTFIIGEILPSRIRGLASGFIYASNEVILAGLLKCYPMMLRTLGIYKMLFLFAFFCFIFGIFVFLFVPETHRHTLLQIEEYFKGNHVLWQRRQREYDNTTLILKIDADRNNSAAVEGNDTNN